MHGDGLGMFNFIINLEENEKEYKTRMVERERVKWPKANDLATLHFPIWMNQQKVRVPRNKTRRPFHQETLREKSRNSNSCELSYWSYL